MTFITILICLALQRFVNLGGIENKWFKLYLDKLQPIIHKFNKWIIILLIILPVFVVLGLLHILLLWRLFGLFYLILASIVLFVSMDARDLRHLLIEYFANYEKNNFTAAAESVNNFIDQPAPTNPQELARVVTKTILYKSCEKIFVVLFWFIILGIYGAAGYCLIDLIRKTASEIDQKSPHKKGLDYAELSTLAVKIQNILDWLPTRILGFSYALAGNFMSGFTYCIKHLQTSYTENPKVAVESGLTALDIDLEDNSKASINENHAALELIDRTLIIWIVAFALISLGMLL